MRGRERERERGGRDRREIGRDSGGIHTNWGVRVLHYAKIPESILARVNPGTRYRRRIEAGRFERKRKGRRREKENEKERTKTTFNDSGK